MTTLILCNQLVIMATLLVGFWQTYRVTRHVETMMQTLRRHIAGGRDG